MVSVRLNSLSDVKNVDCFSDSKSCIYKAEHPRKKDNTTPLSYLGESRKPQYNHFLFCFFLSHYLSIVLYTDSHFSNIGHKQIWGTSHEHCLYFFSIMGILNIIFTFIVFIRWCVYVCRCACMQVRVQICVCRCACAGMCVVMCVVMCALR